ncbi:MAG: GHKL domain-containing protein [Sphaerochaeta sp.]|uniref:GHKL domain-containing protein n=1 Tax=Sphaerochaeta sp. TaxID=1972642 RepID=UPI002FC8F9AF
MSELIPNLIRGSVTSVMNVLLLFTLTKPKHGYSSTVLAAVLIFVADMANTCYFYLYGDLTSVSQANLVTFIIMGICLKPLSKESWLQWTFNYLTTLNSMMMITLLSFFLSRFFPYPQYINTIFRLVLYILLILLFQLYLLPQYQSASAHWPMFSFLILSIFFNFAYYFSATADIQHTLLRAKIPLYLLVLLSIASYGTVFYSLKRLDTLHSLETENLNIQHERALFAQAVADLTERMKLMDQIAYQNSIAAHDRRHFNNMLLSLLQHGEVEQAVTFLQKHTEPVSVVRRSYCENKAVDAITRYYVDLAKEKGIPTEVDITIPDQLPVDSLELALVVANLLENAIKGSQGREGGIRFISRQFGRLALEISNPCSETVVLNASGLPVSETSGHGFGTRSVCAFAAKYHAELIYQVEDGCFRVRLLLKPREGKTPICKG